MKRLALLLALALAGCGSDDWSEPHPKPVAVGTLGPGFIGDTPPAPEATITPRPGSWDGVRPSEGYRVVLLSSGDSAESAVTQWAAQEDVSLKTVIAAASDPVTGIVDAMRLKPDLIVAAGDALVEPLEVVTANHLDQQFLIVGAELGEPTVNVTAATFAHESAAQALQAGVAAVLHGWTGIVIRLA